MSQKYLMEKPAFSDFSLLSNLQIISTIPRESFGEVKGSNGLRDLRDIREASKQLMCAETDLLWPQRLWAGAPQNTGYKPGRAPLPSAMQSGLPHHIPLRCPALSWARTQQSTLTAT